MPLHHGLTDLRDKHLTCFTDMLYSSMVPGNLPSQLEILSMGRNYYETCFKTTSKQCVNFSVRKTLGAFGALFYPA